MKNVNFGIILVAIDPEFGIVGPTTDSRRVFAWRNREQGGSRLLDRAAPTMLKSAKAARRGLSEGLFAWALIAPAMLFIGVIVAWPLVETIRLSFADASMGGESRVGLANYEKLLSSPKFYEIIGRTFYWMALSVSLKLIVGLIGASLLNAAVPGRALFPDCHRLHRVAVALQWPIRLSVRHGAALRHHRRADGVPRLQELGLLRCHRHRCLGGHADGQPVLSGRHAGGQPRSV